MLIYLFVGVLCYKAKLITNEGNKSISNFVLYVANPLLILISYQQDFSVKLLKGLGQTLLLSAIGYAVFIFLGNLLIKNKKDANSAVERFSVIYSNCGFMGIPIAKVLLGYQGVFYITAFNTMFNILAWSHGIVLISEDKSKVNVKKIITNPSIVATIIGMILFVFNLRLPQVPYQACNNLSLLVGPLAMVVAGVSIAQTNLLKAFAKPRIYYVCFLKLILIPVVTILVFKLLSGGMDDMVVVTTVLAFACPAPTMCTMFAILFDKNAKYSSEIFAVSTIVSVITMPLIIYIQQII